MGFSIGRFLGSLAPAIGSIFGPAGTAVGLGVSAALSGEPEKAATVGRQTQPGPISPPAALVGPQTFAPAPTFRATSIGPTQASFGGAIARGAVGLGLGLGLERMISGRGNGNGSPISKILAKARQATGGPVTRNKIIDAAKVCGLEVAAETFGLDVREVCMVVVRGRTRRRRGVSAADIRRTKRTIGFASKIRKDLKALAK